MQGMMLIKRFHLIHDFYSKNKLSICIVFVILTVSTFFMVQILSEIGYYTYTKDQFTESDTKNSIYYMPSQNNTQENPTATNEVKNDILLQHFSALQDVILPASVGVGVGSLENFGYAQACDEAYVDCFQFVDEGRWFSEEEPASGRAEIIISGVLLQNLKIGDEIDIYFGQKDGVDIKVAAVVVGKKMNPLIFQLSVIKVLKLVRKIFLNRDTALYLYEQRIFPHGG